MARKSTAPDPAAIAAMAFALDPDQPSILDLIASPTLRAQEAALAAEAHGIAPVTKADRPKTCAEIYRVDATLGAVGCHRLPRHKGEHRATLTLAAGRKIARTTKKGAPKVARLTRKEFAADLAVKVEAGTISAGDALAKMSAYVTRPVKRASVKRRPVGTVIADGSAAAAVVVA